MKRGNNYFLYISLLIIIVFSIVSISQQNYEFLAYSVTAFLLVLLIQITDKYYSYPNFAKIGILIWLFFHMGGGFFYYAGTRWYGLIFIKIIGEPYNILRYDQVLHFFFYFIIAFFIYRFTISTIANKKVSKISLGIIVALSTVGIGALNEVMEFGVYVSYANSGVGTYINNGLDLIFNTIGAIVGSIFALRSR